MIVKYDTLQRLEAPKFTLCNPGSKFNSGKLSNVIGALVDHESEEIVFNFNSTSELNMRVNLIPRESRSDNAYVSNLYKSIQNRRLIFVDDIGYFMITSVEDGYDGVKRYKDISAKSIDIEIAQKMIPYIANGTYKFTTDNTGQNKGILETIVETLPLWTIGYVDDSVSKKWRTFEDVDTSLNCLAFLQENMQDAYECIFIFDCINRVINIYSQDNYIRQTDIHITKEDLINSLDISENADDIYTAISVLGNDNVTISAINPIGTNVIYDFTHYLSWMSDGLRTKIINWQNDIAAYLEPYYNLNLQYYERLSLASDIQMEIDKLATQIKIYSRCRDNIVAEQNTSLVNDYNKAIVENGGTAITIREEIDATISEITNLIDECESQKENKLSNLAAENIEIDKTKNEIDEIRQELSIAERLTEDEYAELCYYIFEGSYTDEYVTVTDIMTYSEKFEQMKVLYDRAKERLSRVSRPTQEFNIDVENFVFVKEFAKWSEQLETGCLINVELDTNDVALLFLSTITINYDDKTLNMTFGNRFNKFDPKSLFDNMLGDISKSANTLNYIKEILYPIKAGEFNAMKEALQTSRNLTMNNVISSDNEEVIIDGSGYTGRKKINDLGEYDPRQVKLTGRNLVFTNNAWESCEVAIGEIQLGNGQSTYGINAKTIIGDVIVGNGLRIFDNEGTEMFTAIDDRISASIKGLEEGKLTEIEGANNGFEVRIHDLEKSKVDSITTTTGYTFDANGLTIYKSGNEIQNVLDNTGVYVTKFDGDNTEDIKGNILTANNDGVIAINLKAKQYFIMGSNSTFEDYSNGDDTKRTACFYIGE